MESLSDSVNGVNADVPLDNDGGEKVVGALLVDDSGYGPMEKRQNQMAKDEPIIISFPFGHRPEGRRRMKRNARKKLKLYAIGIVVSASLAAVFEVFVVIMGKHIDKVGKNNISVSYQTTYTVYIALAVIAISIAFVFAFFAFPNCLKVYGISICGLCGPKPAGARTVDEAAATTSESNELQMT